MSGCDTVFHVAADYRLWVRDPEEMYRSNVEGTRAILEAARKQWRAARGVYVERGDHRVHEQRAFCGISCQLADEDSPVSLADMIGPTSGRNLWLNSWRWRLGAAGCMW
jgi:dihydroflavonol-4-reductase